MIKTFSSGSAFNNVTYDVALAQKKFGFNSRTDSPLPKQVIQTGHRILGRATVNRTRPVERHHIRMPEHSGALKLMREQLEAIDLEPKKYSLHNMRSGGASLAAALGVPDRLITLMGNGDLSYLIRMDT